jgi:hypothetical protein
MQHDFKTAAVDEPFHFPCGFVGNYPEIPDSSIRIEFAVGICVL